MGTSARGEPATDQVIVRFAEPFCCAEVFDASPLPRARVEFVIRKALAEALRSAFPPRPGSSTDPAALRLEVHVSRVTVGAPELDGSFSPGGVYQARVEIVARLGASGRWPATTLTVAAEAEREFFGALGNWRTSLATRVLRFAAREVGADLVERLRMSERVS